MKDEFTYYTVSWILEKEIKSRKFYNKKEALKWNELLPEEQRYEVKKHTEIIEVIAKWQTKNYMKESLAS